MYACSITDRKKSGREPSRAGAEQSEKRAAHLQVQYNTTLHYTGAARVRRETDTVKKEVGGWRTVLQSGV